MVQHSDKKELRKCRRRKISSTRWYTNAICSRKRRQDRSNVSQDQRPQSRKPSKDPYCGLLVHDGDVGRTWTHLVHSHTKSPPADRAILPETESSAHWTAAAQEKTHCREWQERRFPGHPWCKGPWDLPACSHFSFRCPITSAPCSESATTPGFHLLQFQLPCQCTFRAERTRLPQPRPISTWAILPGYPLHRECCDALACAHVSVSCQTVMPSAWMASGPPRHVPTLAQAISAGGPQHGVTRDPQSAH